MAGVQAGGGLNAGTLNIELIAKLTQLERDMAQVKRITNDTMNDVRRNTQRADTAFAQLGNTTNTMRGQMASATKAAVGFGAALGGAAIVGTVTSMVKAGLDHASALQEEAQQLGVTAKALQEYRYIASQTGVSQEALDTSLTQLTRRLGEAAQGAKGPSEALKRLGISVKDLDGSAREADTTLPLIAAAMAKIESPAEQAAIGADLMGKSFQKMAPFMAEGAEGMEAGAAAAHRLGLVLSDEQLQKADQTADKLEELNRQLSTRIAATVSDNSDAILDLANSMGVLATKTLGAFTELNKFAKTDLGAGILKIQTALSGYATPLQTITSLGTKAVTVFNRANEAASAAALNNVMQTRPATIYGGGAVTPQRATNPYANPRGINPYGNINRTPGLRDLMTNRLGGDSFGLGADSAMAKMASIAPGMTREFLAMIDQATVGQKKYQGALNSTAHSLGAFVTAEKQAAKAVENTKEATKDRVDEDQAMAAETRRTIEYIVKETELQKRIGAARINALRGLSGDSLADELSRINFEYEKQNILLQTQANVRRALDAGNPADAWEKVFEGIARVQKLAQDTAQDDAERALEQNRQRAIDTAHTIADIVGGRIGQSIGELADALAQFDKLTGGKTLDKIGNSLGVSGLGDAVAGMGMGARFGGSVDGLFDAIGIKSSRTGAQIGGAIGQFAGPIGMIAGSILGGIVGGMMKSTPRASATVSVIAGQAMDTAIKGSSGKLKAIAGEMANSVIGGLEQLASALGAELTGNANVSIGQRNGNFRVDTSGSGITKTSRGAIDFGEDKAAAIAFALQDAIKDGVLSGLGASLNKLITGDGDLQAQLQKALSFKAVFDDLAKRDDPGKFAQDEITRWHDAMLKIFTEASATAEELADLERLTGLKRVEAAQQAAEAIEAATNNDERRRLEIQIMELEGKTLQALAETRKLELAGMDESLRPLQERIYALTDEADATAKAAEATRLATEAQEEAARVAKTIADERRSLQIQLYDTIGNPLGEQMRREDTLAGLDPSNRGLQSQIFNALDVAKSAAEMAAAESARRAANERNTASRISEMQAAVDRNRSEAAAAANDNIKETADLHDRLAAAYERESSAIRETIDTLKEFRSSLFTRENGFGNLGSLRAQLMAASPDKIPGLGNEFLSAARGSSSTMLDYQRAVGFVANIASGAIDDNQAQLDRLDAQVEGLVDVKDAVVSVEQAVRELKSEMASQGKQLDDLTKYTKGTNENIDDIAGGRRVIRTEAEAA